MTYHRVCNKSYTTCVTSGAGTASAGFRTNEALCQLSYEAPYLSPEGGRPGKPTQAVGHTCSGNLRIVKNCTT